MSSCTAELQREIHCPEALLTPRHGSPHLGNDEPKRHVAALDLVALVLRNGARPVLLFFLQCPYTHKYDVSVTASMACCRSPARTSAWRRSSSRLAMIIIMRMCQPRHRDWILVAQRWWRSFRSRISFWMLLAALWNWRTMLLLHMMRLVAQANCRAMNTLHPTPTQQSFVMQRNCDYLMQCCLSEAPTCGPNAESSWLPASACK